MVIQEGNRSNNVAQDFLFSKPAVASWHVTHASVARCPGPQPGSSGTRVWDQSHLSQCDRAIGAEYFDRQYCPHRERPKGRTVAVVEGRLQAYPVSSPP